jgi:hypothetical protein
MIRTAAFALAFFTAAGHALAQDQEQMKKNLEKKMESEFLKKAPWVLDFDEAKAAAKKSNKLIFAYFTRSYSR